MSAGFPAENAYAPGDGGLGNPVRTPNDAALYAGPASGQFVRTPGLSARELVIGAVILGGLVYVSEHMRLHRRR